MIHQADLRLAHGTTTSQIIGAFYDVYNGVGFGYGESVYANAMAIALAEREVSFQREVALAVRYRGEVVGEFRADLIAERRVLVEYKVADKVVAAHEGQVVNYLRASGLRVGLILNFGATAAVRRVMWTANRAEPTDDEGAGRVAPVARGASFRVRGSSVVAIRMQPFGAPYMPEFGSWGTDWWKPVLFVVVAGHLTNICVTLFLHRAQTHRGVNFHWLVEMPMRVWLWLTTAIRTKEWVACHRKHHAFADREGDPHSPVVDGLRNILLKGAFYYRKAVRQPGVLEKYGKGTPEDWIERHLLDKWSSVGIVLMLAIDIWLFGFFIGPIVWGIQMIWIPFWAAGVVNGIGHALGYRNHDVKDESRNISPIGILIGGEELHNNHHADPHSAKFAHRWFEFDIGWMYIKLLSFVGLAEVKYAREGAHVRVAES